MERTPAQSFDIQQRVALLKENLSSYRFCHAILPTEYLAEVAEDIYKDFTFLLDLLMKNIRDDDREYLLQTIPTLTRAIQELNVPMRAREQSTTSTRVLAQAPVPEL